MQCECSICFQKGDRRAREAARSIGGHLAPVPQLTFGPWSHERCQSAKELCDESVGMGTFCAGLSGLWRSAQPLLDFGV